MKGMVMTQGKEDIIKKEIFYCMFAKCKGRGYKRVCNHRKTVTT